MQTWSDAVENTKALVKLYDEFPNHMQHGQWELELKGIQITNPDLYNEACAQWDPEKRERGCPCGCGAPLGERCLTCHGTGVFMYENRRVFCGCPAGGSQMERRRKQ